MDRTATVRASLGIAAVLTAVCAFLLPFGPVEVSSPTVRWPAVPAAPESTLLGLTTFRPLDLDVRFGCGFARAAQAAPGGTVLSTLLPEAADAGELGLLVTAADDRVRVRAYGRLLLDEPLPAAPCTYRVTGTASGRPVADTAPPSPSSRLDPGVPLKRAERDPSRFAGPGDATLTVARDGAQPVTVQAPQLPEVAALVTAVRAAPADDAPLSVTLRLDDEASSAPAPLKITLLVALVAALLTTLLLLLLADAAAPRGPPRARRWVPPRVVDVVVPALLLVWLVVAPATDDDGWFATQARNAAATGDVGTYFQLQNQSFTPFTWVYHGLSWWQQVAGVGPVAQRVPALVAGLLTWLVVRRTAALLLEQAAATPATARTVRAALAVAFLAWWLPYDMGVRPESVVALCAAAALHGMLVAAHRGRAASAWWACAVAGAGLVAHPSGVVALAPLLVGAPAAVRACGPRLAAAASGGATALLLGFADGGLRDFLRSQLVTESVYLQDGWSDELERYAFLLDQMPMGSFAKRAAVLACLAGLVWFALLVVAARARRVVLPAAFTTAGTATALAFLLLAVTPSKWTHHFGSLAGLGAVFLAGLLVLGVPFARQVGAGRAVALTAAATAAGMAALAWRGPNSWAYAWLDGVASAYQPPEIAGVAVGELLPWLAIAALAVGGLVLAGRDGLAAAPAVAAFSLAVTVGYLLLTFGVAAAEGTPRASLWARALADPAGRGCAVADAVDVLDPRGAAPLAPAGPVPADTGVFVAGAGWYRPQPPQVTGAAWGTLVGRDGRPGVDSTGSMATGWYALPDAGTPVVTAAGGLVDGNTLVARYGDNGGADLGMQPLTDQEAAPFWRTLVLRPPAGAALVRIEASDGSAGLHGWLAFTAPVAARTVPLAQLLPPGEPVAVGWQLAFGLPCLRPPRIAQGVTEAPRSAVLRADESLGGLDDIAWLPGRGGAFAQVPHTQSVLQLTTVAPADPYLQVYVFDTPLARAAYLLAAAGRTVPGASTAVR